ncbi:hypothetical protein B0681_04180 [Moraxella porci DSM 25326]|uniref:OmpA-like domain-containing protein n=1 Tax=Moraxella porci DSM 25326 TaxID=573983 RepID=A0A1T0CU34_9GAMM|nr:OmpA family protein [Moraxella porci]OOS25880.1 hypothetical protein B0681_04180 [Moraxella porci DSM 25326]
MKFNQIALAVLAAGAATAASAGVTVTPLIGYNYVQEDAAAEKQRRLFETGRQLNEARDGVTNPTNGGVALKSDLYTGLALGVELTPSTQLQVEYGVTNPSARASEDSYYAADQNRFSAEQENISANFLIGTEQFSGYNPATKFKPYVLVGGGMQKTSIENDATYSATLTQTGLSGQVDAGSVVADAGKDTIANLGLGARYLINDALALRGEVRAEHNLDNSWTQGKALAGLEVTLGGRLAPVVPVAPQVEPVAPVVIDDVVVDSDRDGVPDHLDACADTPVNTVVDARGCPVQVNLVEELRQELRVFFDYDKSAIKPQYREEVAKVAAQMQEFPNATAVIEGHASRDSARSNARYNQRLSEARANAVKSMLSNEFGIAPNRLNAVGYGFDRPIAPNDTAEGRAMNRRVEAVITGTKTTTVDQTKDMVVQP